MARYIAGTSRVAIVPPCSANVVGFLVDGEVIMAHQSFQLDGHSQAGDASSNDDDFLTLIHSSKGAYLAEELMDCKQEMIRALRGFI